MGTSKDILEDEIYRLQEKIDHLKTLNKDLSAALDKALEFKTNLVKGIADQLNVVSQHDHDELVGQVEELEIQIENLQYEVNNMPDEYELVDRVLESSSFESTVEDIVKSTLNSVVLKVEVD